MSAPDPTRSSSIRTRVLLRQFREAMAAPGDEQGRLARIVRLIATNMVAEVCSIYMLTSGDMLELTATEGLKPSAVRRARLPVGVGLVGRIAATGAPINTDDAEKTPGFRYIPDIGEETYRSFLGVPIRRQGRLIGVLVVQNHKPRRYDQDEVDALELISTVIAEMTEAGAFDPAEDAERRRRPVMLRGVAAAEGVAMGRVVLHEPKVVLADPIAMDVDTESARLHSAMETVRGEIDVLVSGDGHVDDLAAAARAEMLRAPGEHRDVLETFRLFAHDGGWLRRLEDAVRSGLAAEAAVEKVQTEARARMTRVNDPYLREKLADLDDLANRLLRALLGADPPAPDDLPEDAILVARALGPGELLEYGRGRLKGVALEEGSAGGHAAIVARALGVPLVVGAADLAHNAEPDDPIIIDGDVGHALLRPQANVAAAYREKMHLRAQEEVALRALRDKPAMTRDGARISLQMNAGLLTDLASLAESGAEGVGLFRTELQYLVNSRAPRRDAQTRLYKRVLEEAGERPVVFRTLDMGGDKQLPFLKGAAEENPAMGWRAMRIALDRPLLFRTQLQALLRAGAGRPLSVMFPMIATAQEFDEARGLIEVERDRLEREGREPPIVMKIGVMLETPALLHAPRRFFEQADFISVGGNDLKQFFFAADRGNERVRSRYCALDGAYLRMLGAIVERCAEVGTPLSFCGEMAGRPLEALALVALGYRTLSMRPASIGPVKRALRSLEITPLMHALDEALASDAPTARPALEAFCAAQNVAL